MPRSAEKLPLNAEGLDFVVPAGDDLVGVQVRSADWRAGRGFPDQSGDLARKMLSGGQKRDFVAITPEAAALLEVAAASTWTRIDSRSWRGGLVNSPAAAPEGSPDLELLVAEGGDQAQSAAERGDVAVEDVDSGEVAVLDLGDPSHADAHGQRHLPLGEMLAAADLSQVVSAHPRQQLRLPILHDVRADSVDVTFADVGPLLDGHHLPLSSNSR